MHLQVAKHDDENTTLVWFVVISSNVSKLVWPGVPSLSGLSANLLHQTYVDYQQTCCVLLC